MGLTKIQMKKIYTNLVRAVHYDDRMSALFVEGTLVGYYNSSKGAAAPGVAIGSLLNKDDNLSPHHRSNGVGHMISKGIDVRTFLAEHCGKIEGCGAGRSAFHFCYPEDKVYLLSGFIGYSQPMSIGWGWAAKRRNKQQVVACCSGDGSFQQGRTHESFIFANNEKLPIIYMCENNGMSQNAATDKLHPVDDLADLAQGYGMPGVIVDGQDVFALAEASHEAIARARAGKGPTLIEAKTMRATSHSIGMPDMDGKDVRLEEKREKAFMQRNPLTIARERVLSDGLFTALELDGIDEAATKEFDEIEIYLGTCTDAAQSVEELSAEVFA